MADKSAAVLEFRVQFKRGDEWVTASLPGDEVVTIEAAPLELCERWCRWYEETKLELPPSGLSRLYLDTCKLLQGLT